jgi:phage baseplate assembly protein W
MPQDTSTGRGLLFPLKRVHGDFEDGQDGELLRSNVGNVLGVKAATPDGLFLGEYDWLLGFGAWIDRLRHANLDSASKDDLSRIATIDALAVWEPRVSTDTSKVGVLRTDDGRATLIDVKFRRTLENEGATAVDPTETAEVKVG